MALFSLLGYIFCLFASQSYVIPVLVSSLVDVTLPDEFMYPWRMKDRNQLYLSQTKQNLSLIKGYKRDKLTQFISFSPFSLH